MKKQLYDTVIFDIGNVLMQFNWMGMNKVGRS